MYGKAIRCDRCGKVEFISCEYIEDRRVPGGWYVANSTREPNVNYHFCGVLCLADYAEEEKAAQEGKG